jgi:hypothetical protein
VLSLFTYLSEPDAEPEPDLEAEFEEALLFESFSECEPEFLSDSDPDSWPDSSPDSTYSCRIILEGSEHMYRIIKYKDYYDLFTKTSLPNTSNILYWIVLPSTNIEYSHSGMEPHNITSNITTHNKEEHSYHLHKPSRCIIKMTT